MGLRMWISEFETPRGFRSVSYNVKFTVNWLQQAWFKWKIWTFLRINAIQRNLLRKRSAVETKLTNKSLKEKCKTIHHIEKGMTTKEVSKKFGVPKNTIWTGMKCRVFFFKISKFVFKRKIVCFKVNKHKSFSVS